MKTTTTVMLEGKEVMAIVAKALGIPLENVKPLRCNFAIEGYPEEEVAEKLKQAT